MGDIVGDTIHKTLFINALEAYKVEPAVSDTPLKGPVFTRVFEEFLLLYPRLHPY